MRVRAEFTIYPFKEGNEMPAHVQAGLDAVAATGVDLEIGPLSNIITGEAEAVLAALRAAEAASLGAGATRIVVDVEVA